MDRMKWNVDVEMEQKLEKVCPFSKRMCAVISSHVRTHNNNASIQMLHFNSIQFNSACKIDSVSQFNTYRQNHSKYQVPGSQIHAKIKSRGPAIDPREFAFPWLDIKYRSSIQFATSIYSTICRHFESSSEWKWNYRIKRNIFGLTEHVRMRAKIFRISFWIIITSEGQPMKYRSKCVVKPPIPKCIFDLWWRSSASIRNDFNNVKRTHFVCVGPFFPDHQHWCDANVIYSWDKVKYNGQESAFCINTDREGKKVCDFEFEFEF